MDRRYTLLFLLFFPLLAKGESPERESKLRWEGFIRSILESESLRNGELWHEGRLTVKTRRKEGFRAALEIEVETKTDTLDVREVVFDLKFDDDRRLELGYTQKRLGVEYEEDRQARTTIERSLIYRRLELFTYVGRETILRYFKEDASGSFNDWSITAAVSEAQNGSLVGNWQTPVGGGAVRFGTWLMLGVDKIEGGNQAAAVAMNSFWKRDSESSWQIEWAFGLDPNQSEFEQVFDDDERVFFTGLTGLYTAPVWKEDEESISVTGGSTMLLHDHREPKYNSLGLMLGVGYEWNDLRVSLNAELVGTSSPVEPEKRTYDDSRAALEAIYFF